MPCNGHKMANKNFTLKIRVDLKFADYISKPKPYIIIKFL